MRSTSSHRPNFLPTSRSVPTSSNPHDRCSAIEASWSPTILAITEWKPCVRARATSSERSALPTPLAAEGLRDVDRVLDGRRVRRAGPVGREGAEADDARADLGDDERVHAGVLRHPLAVLGDAPFDEVERDRRPGDLGVVDGTDRLGVSSARRADFHADDTTDRAAAVEVHRRAGRRLG